MKIAHINGQNQKIIKKYVIFHIPIISDLIPGPPSLRPIVNVLISKLEYGSRH